MSLLFDRPESPSPTWVRAGLILVAMLLLSLACWALLAGTAQNWSAVWNFRVAFWHGWLLTVGLSAVALVLSVIIGTLAALARQSTFLPLRGLATLYIEIVRGMPLLVLILVFFYVIADALGWQDRITVGIFVLSLFSGAYIAEIVRAGIQSVGASQRESARAIGLTPLQTYRYIIFPQALRHSLPPLAGQFASLIKDSSLLSIIGISEITFVATQVNSATFSTLEVFIPLALAYLVLTVPISLASRWLEKSLAFET
jgi:polar amino acid transport system permease protein